MLLNDRKIKILEAIINDYIQTAEPIGSRTIAKKYDMGISSATIRNEMSDLEDMGFIVQPHASAGRIPTDKGYRFFVDSLMRRRELSDEEAQFLQSVIANNISQIDYMMQETAKAIAALTKCATIVSEPQVKKARIKKVQFVPVDERAFVMVLVTDTKVVKNHMVYVDRAVEPLALAGLSALMDSGLLGKSSEDITNDFAASMARLAGSDYDVALAALRCVSEVMKTEDDIQIYTSGIRNILSFPEFSDLEKAKAMFQALEEKDMLITLLGKSSNDKIQVLIGQENSLELLYDCSVIKASYSASGQNFGSIGIIGPKRMDYSQAVAVLGGILKHINAVLKAISGR
jgi:heat-inducible transcriptional repressor